MKIRLRHPVKVYVKGLFGTNEVIKAITIFEIIAPCVGWSLRLRKIADIVWITWKKIEKKKDVRESVGRKREVW